MNFIFSLHFPGESGPCDAPASAFRDVTRSFPVPRRPRERPLYISGVLRVGDPVLYVIYCLFRTENELICSFNTFCTCIWPYYVQKTYKTTYDFIFSFYSPGESGPWDAPASPVRDVTEFPRSPPACGSIHYIFRAFSESETPFGT